MKNLLTASLIVLVCSVSQVRAQDNDHTVTQHIKKGAQKTGQGVKKAGQEVGHAAKKTGNEAAELGSKAKAKVTDNVYKGKQGPAGQTVYIDNESHYYWIDEEGHHVYVTASELKDR